MAEVSSIFKIRGRIGNTIFVGRNGKCYARAVATKVTNPNTPKQQMVRARFRVALRFYQRLKDTPLGEIWRLSGKRAKLTGYTLFMRENLNMFDHEGRIVDFDGLRLAVGNRCDARDIEVSLDDSGQVTLRWGDDDEDLYLGENDRLMVALLYGDRLFSPEVVDDLKAVRRDGTVTFRLPRIKDVEVHLYCFFVSPGDEYVSDSQHLKV
ncbi:DUF6266 family protein [Butyricimonas hominis]|jgi:hypothetical protein|uniref:Uncharacterized protein n=1 Tax=Butyricimonas hominis TaxID=2763032 RepID=A0ABR7D6M2_9BACT|nr:DUF6266 family protein [Butyricimonas hominis]MBC5623549.1 hypothetical protein [Butyricimonas hominis]